MLTASDSDILAEVRYQAYTQKALTRAKSVIDNWNIHYSHLEHQPYFLYIVIYLYNEDVYKDIPYKLCLAIEREADEKAFARFAEKVYYNCKRLKVTDFRL